MATPPVQRFRPGRNSLSSLNRMAEAASLALGGVAAVTALADRAIRRADGGFFAKLTGTPEGGSAGEYTFQELYLDADGAWQPLADGRGTITGDVAVEVNALVGLPANLRVWIQQWTDDAQAVEYVFFAPLPPIPDAAKDYMPVYDSATGIKWIETTENCEDVE